MKNTRFLTLAARRISTLSVAGLLLLPIIPPTHAAEPPAEPEKEYQPQKDEFTSLGEAVLKLLRDGDAAKFATNIVPNAADWKSIVSTNLPPAAEDPLKRFETTSDYQHRSVETSAKTLLERATALHLDFAHGDWHVRALTPEHIKTTHWATLQTTNENLPWAQKVEFVLDPGTGSSASTNGDYKLVVRSAVKYPGGWRSYSGVQLAAVPNNVGDENSRRDLAIAMKVSEYQGLTNQDDPGLLKLGETLVHLLRERDSAIYERDLHVTPDQLWAQIERSGRKAPARKQFDEQTATRAKDQFAIAQATVKQMTDAGIDLKNAKIQIKEAAVEHLQSQSTNGSLEGLIGQKFQLKLTVQSGDKASNGAPLSGQYILAANQVIRFGNDWKVVDNLHWHELPEGVLGQEAAAKLKFENYVTEHRTLPPETAAPDFDFVTLDGEKKMKLSDFKGKVVVLDFWATWCGPCQTPMADLQKLRDTHPDWKDQVVIVPLSIDETMDVLHKHVDKRGWTNTFNVWTEGAWHSKPVTSYRVSGIPTTYIIDPTGKIVKAGHPMSMKIPELVDGLLKK